MSEKPRILFLGTPEFAVHSLARLIEHAYEIAAVVTAPDQPAGRGQTLQQSPVKKYALEAGLRVLQPVKLKDPLFIETLKTINADLFIVVAFRMLPEAVWQMPRLGTFNLHASLLPQYRGAAPINHAIINGEKESGITTFFLKKEIDTGEIIFQERMAIGPEETAGELHDRMMMQGAALVVKTADAIADGQVKTFEQDLVTAPGEPLRPAPKIFKTDCKIDWSRKSNDIFNQIRGLSPYPGAYTLFISPDGENYPVKIFRAHRPSESETLTPGRIITDGKSQLAISSGDGLLQVIELQLAGKKMMKTGEFLRGFRLNSDWKTG